MSGADNPLSTGDIEACNVLPAYFASLELGVSPAELEAHAGLRQEYLEKAGAQVRGEQTYQHFEYLHGLKNYPQIVLSAVRKHTASSLGVVGLACKTAPSVHSALRCHQRFQSLTNRTAEYRHELEGEYLLLKEERPGEARLGSLLVSDYTMLVAVQLLRQLVSEEVPVLRMKSRRSSMAPLERQRYQEFLGAEIELGGEHAQLSLDRDLFERALPTADPELSGYFQKLLEKALPQDQALSELRQKLRNYFRDQLPHLAPQSKEVAKLLGMGQRTLQRRLASEGTSFAGELDTTRRLLADNYLQDPQLSISEVGFLCGYAEQASFFKAFQRWYQTTPGKYRQQ